MKLSKAGALLIANFEGFSSRPYRDAVGVWTIGYGSTHGVGPGTKSMTRAEALARLQSEVDREYGAAVNRLGLPLNQNQFDALCSFVYNLGPGAIGSDTTIGRRLRAHDWRGAGDAMLAWDKAGGRTLLGLKRRRHTERLWFLKPYRAPDVLAKDERYHVGLLRKRGVSTARRARAIHWLRTRSRNIQKAARRSRGGWSERNRRTRFQRIRKLLGG